MLNALFSMTLWLFILVKSSPTKTHVLKEKTNRGFLSNKMISYQRRADRLTPHKVIFSIAQLNMEELKKVLENVSDPFSADYGKHWSKQKVAEFTSNPEGRSAVHALLKTKKEIVVERETIYGEFIFATAPVHIWEEMFATTFHEYKINDRKNNSRRIIRAEEYSLPLELVAHISSVFNSVQFHGISIRPTARKTSSSEIVGDGVIISDYVTPALINQVYSISDNTGSMQIKQAVYESEYEDYSPSDLTFFQSSFGLPLQAVSEDINGHNYTCYYLGDCGEGNLDIQYIMGVAQNVYTIYDYSYDDSLDWMLSWITSVANSTDPADVYSISYSQAELALSSSYTESFDVEAIKLGVMGTTIVAASGDDGAASSLARDDSYYCGYIPQFPASSPYVVAVGATNVSHPIIQVNTPFSIHLFIRAPNRAHPKWLANLKQATTKPETS